MGSARGWVQEKREEEAGLSTVGPLNRWNERQGLLLRALIVDFCEFTLEHGTNEPAGRIALLFEAIQPGF